MTPAYQRDLAWVHHAGFSDFAASAAPGVLAMLRDAGIHRGLVVDLGSGSGVWARSLCDAGYAVLGIDASLAMTAMARRVAPTAAFRTASLHDAPMPAAAAVTALGESLGYVAHPRDRASLAPLFARVARALPAGGLFIFDLVIRSTGRPMQYRSWTTGDDWAVLVEVEETPERALLRRDITTFRRVRTRYRRSSERQWVRVHAREDIERWLRTAGFSVRTMRRYGRFTLAPRRLAFRARKPA